MPSRPFFRVVECARGWLLIVKGTGGKVKHSCGWTSKRVPLGKDPEAYRARLNELTREHERRHAVA